MYVNAFTFAWVCVCVCVCVCVNTYPCVYARTRFANLFSEVDNIETELTFSALQKKKNRRKPENQYPVLTAWWINFILMLIERSIKHSEINAIKVGIMNQFYETGIANRNKNAENLFLSIVNLSFLMRDIIRIKLQWKNRKNRLTLLEMLNGGLGVLNNFQFQLIF